MNEQTKHTQVLLKVQKLAESGKFSDVKEAVDAVLAEYGEGELEADFKNMLYDAAEEARAVNVRDTHEFKATLLAERVMNLVAEGHNVISNIAQDGVNIELSGTMDTTLKHPTSYFYESNNEEDEEGGIELLSSLCHDLNNSKFTYYTNDALPSPEPEKANILLADKIGEMMRYLVIEFIKGYDNATCKRELQILYKEDEKKKVNLCITMSGVDYVSTTELMSKIQKLGVEEAIKQEAELIGY